MFHDPCSHLCFIELSCWIGCNKGSISPSVSQKSHCRRRQGSFLNLFLDCPRFFFGVFFQTPVFPSTFLLSAFLLSYLLPLFDFLPAVLPILNDIQFSRQPSPGNASIFFPASRLLAFNNQATRKMSQLDTVRRLVYFLTPRTRTCC